MEKFFATNGITSGDTHSKSKIKSLLNSVRKDKFGDETDKFQKLLSNSAKAIIEGGKYSEGYQKGMALVNEIVKIDIEAKGQADISNRLSIFGTVHNVGMNEGAVISVYGVKRAGGSREVAEGASTPMMSATERTITPERKQLTSFVGVNYRKMISNPIQEFTKVKEEAIKDLNNKIVQYAERKLVEGVVNNGTINKLYFAGAVTPAVVDDAVGQIRAFTSKPSIVGGYSAVSPIAEFPAARESNEAYNEFNELGYVANYKGASVAAYINPLDYTTTETNATYGEVSGRLLKENTIYVLPAGGNANDKSFGHSVLYGTTTSQTGNHIASGKELIRYDQSMGYQVIDEHSEFIAVIETV